MAVEVIVGAIAVVVAAVGAGLSYSASQDAAAQQKDIAAQNFALQTQSINQQAAASSLQAQIAQQLASNEKMTMDRNAVTLEQQAAVNTAAGADNMKRTREDYARMLAAQRAQIGKSGVVDTTGSPLQLLSATATQEQRAADGVLFQTESDRRNLFREADNQRAQGVSAEMGIYDAQARGSAAQLSASNQLSQAQMNLYSSNAAASGIARQGQAALLSSAGNLGFQTYQTLNPRTSTAGTVNNYYTGRS